VNTIFLKRKFNGDINGRLVNKVPGNSFDRREATVVCKQLGFNR